MDLTKASDCFPHDLLIAKLAGYGFNNSTIKLSKSRENLFSKRKDVRFC